jgi:hypothetical protein
MRASRIIEKLDAGFLSELIRYEDFMNGGGQFCYTARPPLGLASVHIPYDLESFYMSLMFYGRASAPSFLYQQLDIEPGCLYRTTKT